MTGTRPWSDESKKSLKLSDSTGRFSPEKIRSKYSIHGFSRKLDGIVEHREFIKDDSALNNAFDYLGTMAGAVKLGTETVETLSARAQDCDLCYSFIAIHSRTLHENCFMQFLSIY